MLYSKALCRQLQVVLHHHSYNTFAQFWGGGPQKERKTEQKYQNKQKELNLKYNFFYIHIFLLVYLFVENNSSVEKHSDGTSKTFGSVKYNTSATLEKNSSLENGSADTLENNRF